MLNGCWKLCYWIPLFCFYVGRSEQSSESEEWLQTSVRHSSMEQRISRLGQFINEAQWRFQLVSWDNGTNRQIIKSSRKRMNRKLQRIASSDKNWKAVAAQDEDSDDTLTEGTSGENWEIKRFDRCKQWNDFYANVQISEVKKWCHVQVRLKSFLLNSHIVGFHP